MESKFSRRELALGTLAGTMLARAQESGQVKPANTTSIDDPDLDPVRWTKLRYKDAPLRMTFNASTRKEAEAWQKRLRAKVTELVGGFPERGPAPVAKTLEVREFPTYKREKF